MIVTRARNNKIITRATDREMKLPKLTYSFMQCSVLDSGSIDLYGNNVPPRRSIQHVFMVMTRGTSFYNSQLVNKHYNLQ